MKYLAIEFSNKFINQFRDYRDIYNNRLMMEKVPFYNKWNIDKFNEYPLWTAHVNGILNKDLVFKLVDNIEEAIKIIIENTPEFVFFSVMEVTKYAIYNIITNDNIDNNITTFILGRANITYPNNVKIIDSIEQLNKEFNFNKPYNPIFPKELSEGRDVLGRIYLTHGCNFGCKFCVYEKKVKLVDIENIQSQFNLYNKSEYIYIGDLTFGQTIDWQLKCLKSFNNKQEFIVQTNARVIINNINKLQDWYNHGIRYVELGVETFSEETLKRWGKPSSSEDSINAIKYLNAAGLKVIPNIMVNIKGETYKDYLNTIDWLNILYNYVYYLNIFFFADYDNEKDNSELNLIKSWNTTNKQKLDIENFANDLFSLNFRLLNNII